MRKGDRHPPFSHRRGETDARLAGSRSANRDHDASVTEARPPDRRWQTYDRTARIAGSWETDSEPLGDSGQTAAVSACAKGSKRSAPPARRATIALQASSIHLSIYPLPSQLHTIHHPPQTAPPPRTRLSRTRASRSQLHPRRSPVPAFQKTHITLLPVPICPSPPAGTRCPLPAALPPPPVTSHTHTPPPGAEGTYANPRWRKESQKPAFRYKFVRPSLCSDRHRPRPLLHTRRPIVVTRTLLREALRCYPPVHDTYKVRRFVLATQARLALPRNIATR